MTDQKRSFTLFENDVQTTKIKYEWPQSKKKQQQPHLHSTHQNSSHNNVFQVNHLESKVKELQLMAQRLEKKNEEIVGKVLKKGQVNLVIEDRYYQDIPKSQKQQYTAYFQKIWRMPLLHNQRSTNIIQAFWKEILRRSYLANKSGAYKKLVHNYGQNYRQKFSLYYPNQKPSVPLSIVIFIHGGYFINGTQQAFEYLGKGYIQKGYLICTMGFRQLPNYRWPDPYDDCHKGFQDLIKIAPQYGGNPNSIIYLSWSGGGLVTLTNFFRHTNEYEQRVKLFIAVGSPWEVSIHEKKVASVFVDDPKQLNEVFPYGYMGRRLSIPINLVVGTKDRQFPQIYEHNYKYYKIYKENGLNVTINEVQNHDHYDLILDVDVSLTKIKQHEIKNIDPNNQISRLLFTQSPEQKQQWFEILKNPIWKPDVSASLQKARLITVERFRIMNNLIGRNEHINNYLKIFTLFEVFGSVDASCCTKTMTHSSSVASIGFLGTSKHQYLLDEVAKGKVVFAFALTEAGGGNNLSECGTKATYDQKTKQFIFHNQTQFSKKFWCANLGMHANYALVFARLIVKGQSQGTHAFVVKIRDQNHQPLPGIILEDIGHKIGMNGIDNGSLRFDNHRVHKDALLNKLGDINQQGVYTSDIKSTSQRFFKVIDRLLAGRLYIASIVCGMLKNLAIIGVTFSRYRYGISETGQTQIPIGNFQLQKNDVIPVISKTVVLILFHHYCKEVFCTNQKNIELSNLCNIDKILFTQHLVHAGIVIRERCGAQGIISKNLIGQYIAIGLGASTGQGDNKVLVIKVAKDCLKLIGSKQLSLPISKINKITSIQQLKSLQILLGLYQKREATMFQKLTTKIAQLRKERKQPYQIMLKFTWEQMKNYSYAYGERLAFENAIKVFERFKDPQSIDELRNHLLIQGLSYLIENIGFYAYRDLIPFDVGDKIVELRSSIIRESAKKVQILIHKLNTPEHAVYSPLSKGDYFNYYKDLPINTQIPPHL